MNRAGVGMVILYSFMVPMSVLKPHPRNLCMRGSQTNNADRQPQQALGISFSFTCKPSIYGKDLQHWPGAMGWTVGQGFFVKDEVGICQRFLFSDVEVSFEVESHQD